MDPTEPNICREASVINVTAVRFVSFPLNFYFLDFQPSLWIGNDLAGMDDFL